MSELYFTFERYNMSKTGNPDNDIYECPSPDCMLRFQGKELFKSHLKRCKCYREDVNYILSENALWKYIGEKGKPCNALARELSERLPFYIQSSHIFTRCKNYGIETKSISESINNKDSQERRKRKYKELYGVENPSQNPIVKKKKDSTCLKHYGVLNPFQSEEIKEKIKETNIKIYGVSHPIHRSSIHNKSNPHMKISGILNKNNIKHENEKLMKWEKYNSFLKRNYNPIPDILIEDKKSVIEIYGDYWHGNPNKYDDEFIISLYDGRHSAYEVRKRDYYRQKQIESFGYSVIIIWEEDMLNKSDTELEEMINQKFKEKNIDISLCLCKNESRVV